MAAHREAHAIYVRKLGAFHPAVGASLAAQAGALLMQEKYSEAEPLFGQALGILEAQQGRTTVSDWGMVHTTYRPQYTQVSAVLNNLALLYERQGRLAEAEATLRRTLSLYERESGKNSEGAAMALLNLGAVLTKQKRFPEAEPALKRSLAIRENLLGPDHPLVVDSLDGLAEFYRATSNTAEADRCSSRIRVTIEKNKARRVLR